MEVATSGNSQKRYKKSAKGKADKKSYQKRLYDRLRAVRADIKLERGCSVCGYAENSSALDFHHLPGETKSFDVGNPGGRRTIAATLREIDKCEVLCANCHRVRTHGSC